MSDRPRRLSATWEQGLPIDPDVDPTPVPPSGPADPPDRPVGRSGTGREPGRKADASPFEPVPRARWPRLHADVIAVVFVGGCVGGYARYAVGLAWQPPPGGFPAATLAVNLVGAFVLAVVVVVATGIRPSRYLRPLLGTGFCGALTTFSAVVVALAQLLAQARYAVAAAYLGATVVGGLAAAALGLVLARAVEANRHRAREAAAERWGGAAPVPAAASPDQEGSA